MTSVPAAMELQHLVPRTTVRPAVEDSMDHGLTDRSIQRTESASIRTERGSDKRQLTRQLLQTTCKQGR